MGFEIAVPVPRSLWYDAEKKEIKEDAKLPRGKYNFILKAPLGQNDQLAWVLNNTSKRYIQVGDSYIIIYDAEVIGSGKNERVKVQMDIGIPPLIIIGGVLLGGFVAGWILTDVLDSIEKVVSVSTTFIIASGAVLLFIPALRKPVTRAIGKVGK